MPRMMLTVHHYLEGSQVTLEALKQRIHDVWETDDDVAILLSPSDSAPVLASNVLEVSPIAEI